LSSSALPAERYIATNRFNVRPNNGPKFEKRWAERKSRLAELNGFRFFTLLRRVEEFGANYEQDGDNGNYISLTVWEDKPSFDAWRQGDAFKEAHGGGKITDFIQLLTTAIFILNGGPKPAFFDGLLPIQNKIDFNLETEGGWRKVVS
jgi:heme-degrading monooxygenase HmoA